MAIKDDIAVDSSGNFYYTGAVHGAAGAGYYTVIEFHRYAQDLADDATAAGDDLIDITSETPSDRSTDNIISLETGYRLDDANGSATDAISEHLYDGSIIQKEDGTIFDGLVVIAAEGMDLQIIQNGAIVADDFWNTVPNGETTKGLNRDTANGISHRFMLKVNNAGSDIDGRRFIGITRELGQTYSEFRINGSARGNNVLALTYASDLNNQKTDATLSGYTDIANTEGYRLIDIDGNGTPEPYYSEWDKGSRTTNDVYERLKWLTSCESGSTDATPNGSLYGLDGNIFRGITHELVGTQSAGTFVEPESVTWTGGTGQLLAIDSTTAGTKMYIQLLTGVAPTSGNVSGATGVFGVTGNTEKTVATPFVGQSTGSAIIGAYGFAIEAADTTASDLFTDLDNNTNQPPNNVTFAVAGMEVGEDRVLVGPEDGSGGLRQDQCDVATGEAITVTSGAVSSATSGAGVVVLASGSETIGTGNPSEKDTPTAGTIRVLDANGVYQIVNYTSFSSGAGTLTFSGCTSTGTWSAAALNNAHLSYIDKLAASAQESYTVVYSGTPRTLFIRVRDGGTAGDLAGIKTFQTTGTLGAAGGSTTVIRTADE